MKFTLMGELCVLLRNPQAICLGTQILALLFTIHPVTIGALYYSLFDLILEVGWGEFT